MEEWVKKTETLIRKSVEIPMWGNMPTFPWEEFTERMQKVLSLPDLSIEMGDADWRMPDQILKGFGKDAVSLSLQYTPITDEMFLALPKDDLNRLATWVYDKKHFTDPDLSYGFFQYVTLHALDEARSFQLLHGLSPKVTGSPMPSDDAYCIDLAITSGDETIWGRLICPKPFHSAFQTHFESHPVDLSTVPEAAALSLSVTLEAGHTELPMTEWETVQVGDLILLDRCTYRPNEKSGSFLLKLGTHPLAFVSLKNGEMKVLDYAPLNQEEPNEEAATEEEVTEEEKEKPSPTIFNVELTRLEMSAHDILSLKPGQALPLDIPTEQTVTLTQDEKSVGKGELTPMGDHIGIKLLEISNGK